MSASRPRAGHASSTTSSPPTGCCSRATSGAQRARHRRARARLARRLRSRRAVHAHRCTRARHPARRAGLLRRAAAGAADELRRAALRAVGAAELVGVRRRRAPLAGLPEVPRRRAHAHAGGRAGPGDQRAHRRLHPAAADVRPLARRAATPTALLDGPTSDVWIDPWLSTCAARGVDLRAGQHGRRHRLRRGRIAGVTVERHGTRATITADYYVAALPVEQLRALAEPDAGERPSRAWRASTACTRAG